MKRFDVVVPKSVDYVDPETKKVIRGYLPEGLVRDEKHRVTKVKRNGWGTLIQTDRLPEWMNADWFSRP